MRFFYLLPPVMYRVPQYVLPTANSQKNPTIQHQTTFTLQDTANAPPQMPLENPAFTAYVSSLLEKALQNGLNRLLLKKSCEVVTHQVTPHGNPKTSGIHYVE